MMNRRGFMQWVGGFVGGVAAALALPAVALPPTEQSPELPPAPPEEWLGLVPVRVPVLVEGGSYGGIDRAGYEYEDEGEIFHGVGTWVCEEYWLVYANGLFHRCDAQTFRMCAMGFFDRCPPALQQPLVERALAIVSAGTRYAGRQGHFDPRFNGVYGQTLAGSVYRVPEYPPDGGPRYGYPE